MIVQLFIFALLLQAKVSLEEPTSEPNDMTTPDIDYLDENDTLDENGTASGPLRCYVCSFTEADGISLNSAPGDQYYEEFQALLAEVNDLGKDNECEDRPDRITHGIETCDEGVTVCVSEKTEIYGSIGSHEFEALSFERLCGEVDTKSECSVEPNQGILEYFTSKDAVLETYNISICPCIDEECEPPHWYQPEPESESTNSNQDQPEGNHTSVSSNNEGSDESPGDASNEGPEWPQFEGESTISCYKCTHGKILSGMGKDFFLDVILHAYLEEGKDMYCATDPEMYETEACYPGVNSCYYGTIYYTGTLNNVSYKLEMYSRGCADPGEPEDICIKKEEDMVPDDHDDEGDWDEGHSEGDMGSGHGEGEWVDEVAGSGAEQGGSTNNDEENGNEEDGMDWDANFTPSDMKQFLDVCLCKTDKCNTKPSDKHAVNIRSEPLKCYNCSYVHYTINGKGKDDIEEDWLGQMLFEMGASGDAKNCESYPELYDVITCPLDVHRCTYAGISVSANVYEFMDVDVQIYARTCGEPWNTQDTCEHLDEAMPLEEMFKEMKVVDLKQNFTTCHCSGDLCTALMIEEQAIDIGENDAVQPSDDNDDTNRVDGSNEGETTTRKASDTKITLNRAEQKVKDEESVASCVQVFVMLPMLSAALALSYF